MNYDPIETCCFDPAHRIIRSRMQFHITKCAKNYPDAPMKQCPYDARHIVNEIEFNNHITICPQRESVLHYKIVDDKAIESLKILPIDQTPVAAITEENWEEDEKCKSYDPMKCTENKPVIRMLTGAQKAERKEYQQQERLRISRLEDVLQSEKQSTLESNHNQHTLSIKASTSEEISIDADQEYIPLRRPKKFSFDSSKTSDFSSINDATTMNQTQNSFNHNESLQLVEKSNAKENVTLQPREMSSYAAALKQKQNSVKFDHNKENNSSLQNSSIDENLMKVSKTVEELTIGDKGHKVESESLDRTLQSLKKNRKE